MRLTAIRRDWCYCQACGSELKLTTHHIWPRSLGGSHEYYNLVTLCLGCHVDICQRCSRDLDKRVKTWMLEEEEVLE